MTLVATAAVVSVAAVSVMHDLEELAIGDDKQQRCRVCLRTFKRTPVMECAGLPDYGWWDQVPANLKTKTQLAQAGLKPGPAGTKGIRVAQISYGVGSGSRREWKTYHLFDQGEAYPKKTATPAQLAALEKARVAQLTCQTCGAVVADRSDLQYKECSACIRAAERRERAKEEDAVIRWARRMLKLPNLVVLDTETTDLGGEIVDIAVIDGAGNVLFDTLVKPAGEMNPEAERIHGISLDMLQDAPTFGQIWPDLAALLRNRVIVTYNAEYDAGVLSYEIRHAVGSAAGAAWMRKLRFRCLMLQYATYHGEWSDYWGGYKYQPLYGDHRALGDCRAALHLLRCIAKTWTSTEAAQEKEARKRRRLRRLIRCTKGSR